MSDGTAIVPQAFLGILEMPSDDIDERIDRNDHAWLKSIQIVYRHHSRFRVPLVTLEHLVIGLDMRRRHVVFAKHISVEIGIFVTGFLVVVETERLMIPDRE